MENAREVIKIVTDNVKQKSSSKKDEVTVMKALMNDTEYSTKIYGTLNGVETHYPSRELRKIVANAVSSITKIPIKEATELADKYEFTKTDAQGMVNLSKEFTYTYLKTGRKLPLGGRIDSDIQLAWKNISAREARVPSNNSKVLIPEHGGIKSINKTPDWIISNENGKVIGTTYDNKCD